MPLFMDVHDKVDGLTAEAVAEAHQRELQAQPPQARSLFPPARPRE